MKKILYKLLFILIVTMICALSIEVGSRFIWKIKYNQWLEGQLSGYDYIDYKRSLIIPKANIKLSVDQCKSILESHNKTLGLQKFEDLVRQEGIPGQAVAFSLNQYGFKGPEFIIPKPDSVYRILTIGDSCTWGNFLDRYSYPRVMEEELNRLVGNRGTLKVEVINAGVRGYNFERILKMIDKFLAVDPDLVTIYVGWNRTIGRADPNKNQFLYRRLDIYKIFYHLVINKEDAGIAEDFKKTFYRKDDPIVARLQEYSFKYDIDDLNMLVDKIRTKNKSIDIVLITLAGLLDWRVEPSKETLKMAYPISSTYNLYAYSVLTKRYNQELRNFARDRKLQLIDLEEYAYENFVPRSKYYFDSVHPRANGYLRMGKLFAAELVKHIPGLGEAGP